MYYLFILFLVNKFTEKFLDSFLRQDWNIDKEEPVKVVSRALVLQNVLSSLQIKRSSITLNYVWTLENVVNVFFCGCFSIK